MQIAYQTGCGVCYQGLAEDVLASESLERQYRGQIDLIFTSPPYPLNNKKKYGNLQGQEYVDWLAGFAPIFRKYLSTNGSIVIEVGNAWEPGRPVMSTLALEALLQFQKNGRFQLCQQFVYYNPARLPTPAQWVNVKRTRVKDSFTNLWWLALIDDPKADNRRVLKEYSEAMQRLLKTKKYNAGKRPSEHNIGKKSFLTDNSGAIPSNVITAVNTHSSTDYLKYCRLHDLPRHPARMPIDVAKFFIKFLTEPGDVVLDPFAGSNTTGAAAEYLERKWIAIEPNLDYVIGSQGRFSPLHLTMEMNVEDRTKSITDAV